MSKTKEIEPIIAKQINATSWIYLQELLSDLLGALMPGILFIFVVGLSYYLFIRTILKTSVQLDPIISIIFDNMSLEISISFFVFAYIIGSVFYRKDPKEPDIESAKYVWENTDESNRNSLAVQKLEDGDFNVEYPYLHIYEYLSARDYHHLATHIKWRGSDKNSYRNRSKMFINILKTRINYYRPNNMSEIMKNEAHIRLISSLWYCIKWILKVMLVLSFLLLCYMISTIKNNDFISMLPFISYIVSLSILFISIKNSIIKFFHYQRVREIVFVLETAHIISIENNKIFKF